jgi:hypothetical protein
VTLGVSLVAPVIADGLLLHALRPPFAFGIAIVFFGGIVYMLYRLRLAAGPREEQAMIGIGARLGNGLLLSVLGWLLLSGAPVEHRFAFVFLVAAVYGYGFAVLCSRLQDIVIGYKE